MKDILKLFVMPILIAFIIGIIADKISTLDKADYRTSDFVNGFFLIIPIAVIVLILFFQLLNIRKRTVVIVVTTLAFILSMVFTVQLSAFRAGLGFFSYGEQVIVYWYSLIPSIIVGILFGFYLAWHINKRES